MPYLVTSAADGSTDFAIQTMAKITFSSENPSGDCPGILQGESDLKQGLIVLQAWWGMNEQIIEAATYIGKLGNFITLVPDLYRGTVTADYEEAGHLMNNLDWDGAVKDIQGAAKYLLSNGCNKVGVTGFCMGGALSLAAAIKVPEISATAPFYGIPSAEFFDVSKITIPVQAHFCKEDVIKGFSAPEDAEALKEKLKGNKDFTLFMYPCGHAFIDKSCPNFNEKEREIALGRLVEFMKKYLV